MARTWQDDVHDFHVKFCPDKIGNWPATPDHSTGELRYNLMLEELKETRDAMVREDLADVADGLVDLIYVAIGTAVSYGIDLDEVWEAVHAANMAKTGGGTRADGKILKPPGWTPPDVAGIIQKQIGFHA